MKEKPRRGKRHALLKTLTAAVGAATLFDGYFNRALATTFTASWRGQASGSYSLSLNWSTSSVPNDFAGNDYNVIINRPAGAAVEGNVTAEILNLTVGAGNSLSLDPGIQLILIGQANGGPATIDNDGTIALNSNTSGQSRLEFTNGPTSLTGSGTITMSGDSLFANPPGGFSSSNFIRGSGGIEFFTIENDGTILADSSDGSLNLNPITTMTNNGWLRATGPGVLVLSSGSLITNNGTILAQMGGTISISGGGALDSSSGTMIVQSGGALINSTTLTVPAVQVDGQFTNLLVLHGSAASSTMITGTGSFTNGDATHTSASALVTAMRVSTFTAGGGVTTVKAGGGTLGTSLLSSISIASGAKLDLTDHDMVINYSGGSPLNTIAGLLSSGYAHGAWNGTGIDSSIAAAIDTPAQPHPVALGYGEASTLGITGTFSGQNIGNTTVLIKYTYVGDANLDGHVDVADLYLLASHWNTSGDVWSGGDFNYDGLTNINDLNLLAQNWNAGEGNPLAPALGPMLNSLGLPSDSTSVTAPEPVGVASLESVALALAKFRRSRRRRH